MKLQKGLVEVLTNFINQLPTFKHCLQTFVRTNKSTAVWTGVIHILQGVNAEGN